MNKFKEKYFELVYPHFINDKKIPPKKFCFIISSGRTGTTFLSKYFNQFFDDVLSVHEPKVHVKSMGKKFLNKDISMIKAKKLFLSLRRDLYINKSKKNSIIIESNPTLGWLVPLLKDLFDNPKIIFVTRDPKTYVRSAFDKIPQESNPDKLFYSKEDMQSRLTPYYFKNDSIRANWENMERFEKICWFWNRFNKHIYSELKEYDNLLIVKFEDIFQNDNSNTIKKMIDFFELRENLNVDFYNSLKLFGKKINDNQNYKYNKDFKKWSEKDQNTLLEYTSEMRKVLGY